MNPLKSVKKSASESSPEHNVLLKVLDIEFEVRRSNLVEFYSQEYLEACICEVKLNEENIQDLQNSEEIDPAATLVMEVVSKDRRALKTRIKELELIEYIGKAIPQRMFLPGDVIQI